LRKSIVPEAPSLSPPLMWTLMVAESPSILTSDVLAPVGGWSSPDGRSAARHCAGLP